MSKIDTTAVKRNAVVLSNCSAMAAAIVSALGEKYISKTLNNESLTRDKIEQITLTKLTKTLTTA